MTEQGYPPRRPGGRPGQYGRRPDQYDRVGWSRTPQEPGRSGWERLDAFDPGAEPEDEPPPWVGPGVQPLRPVRRPRPASVDVVDVPSELPPVSRQAKDPDTDPEPRRGGSQGSSRAAATRRRRSRRRLVTLAGVVVVVAAVVAAVYFLRQPAAKTGGPIVTLQKGEYGKVPDACRAVPSAALAEFLGPAPKQLRPQFGQCTFTVDTKARFRELNVQIQAFQPNAGYRNGSATANAAYNFAQQRRQLYKPPKGTPSPPAKITPVGGLGTAAFVAVQEFHVGVGAITNKVILLVLYRNVLITTSMQGDARGAASTREYELRAGALAISRALLSAVKAEPAVG